jgi:hypothetical protein
MRDPLALSCDGPVLDAHGLFFLTVAYKAHYRVTMISG